MTGPFGSSPTPFSRGRRPLFASDARCKANGLKDDGGIKKRRDIAVPPLRPIDRRFVSLCGSQGIAPRHSKEHRCRRISRRPCDALPKLPTRLRSGCCGQAACRNARIVVVRHVCSTRGRISPCIHPANDDVTCAPVCASEPLFSSQTAFLTNF